MVVSQNLLTLADCRCDRLHRPRVGGAKTDRLPANHKPHKFSTDPGDCRFNCLAAAYHLRWEAKNETAYLATFVIDRERKIQFAKISMSHGGRASADEVLKALIAK